MRISRCVLLSLASLIALAQLPAFGQCVDALETTDVAQQPPIVFDGHRYELYLYTGGVTANERNWQCASNYAGAQTHQPPAGPQVTGHLATLTSAAEDDSIENLRSLHTIREVWVGGSQVAGCSPEPGCGWSWVNSEGTILPTNNGLTYANWQPGEPNNTGGNERHLGIGHTNTPGWNDEIQTGNVFGFIVEYDVPLDVTTFCVASTEPTAAPGTVTCSLLEGAHSLSLPPRNGPNGDDSIGISRFEFTDPRFPNDCGRVSLVLEIRGDWLTIPPYLCGSPKFIVEKTEPAGFQILRGTITAESDLKVLLPLNFATQPQYISCGLPEPPLPPSADQQHRAVFVWQATNPANMIEGGKPVPASLGSASVSYPIGAPSGLPVYAAAGEFSDHCSPSRGLTRSGSFFVIGMHIDFGLPWDGPGPSGTVFKKFVELTRYKLLVLRDAVDAAKPFLKNGDYTKMRQQHIEAALKAIDRGDYANALVHMENFIKFAQTAVYTPDPTFNHNGEHLMRAYNITFMLRDKILPAVQ